MHRFLLLCLVGALCPVGAVAQTPDYDDQSYRDKPIDLAKRKAELSAQIQANPQDVAARKELAAVHFFGGDMDAAEAVIAKLRLDNPKDADVLHMQGILLDRQ